MNIQLHKPSFFIRYVSPNERKVVIYEPIDDDMAKTFDGKKVSTKLISLIDEEYSVYNNSDILYVKNDIFHPNQDIEEVYAEYIAMADELKSKSNNIINMYKTNRFMFVALNLFARSTNIKKIEPIDTIEETWIDKSWTPALIFAENGYNGPGYKYDHISMYPSILKSMYWPVKKGVQKHLSKEEFETMLETREIPYGLYKCKIDIEDERLFKPSRNKRYYTHIDIHAALDLGYTIKIKQKSEYNAYIYGKDNIVKGKEIFGPYVDFLFELKQQKVPYAKMLLNMLWGLLVKENTFKLQGDIDPEKTKILKILPNFTFLVRNKNKKMYEYNYARIKPFILAYARRKMTTVLKDYADDIVYIHTDGFILSKPMSDSYKFFGTTMNLLKYEGHDPECEITNLSKKKFISI